MTQIPVSTAPNFRWRFNTQRRITGDAQAFAPSGASPLSLLVARATDPVPINELWLIERLVLGVSIGTVANGTPPFGIIGPWVPIKSISSARVAAEPDQGLTDDAAVIGDPRYWLGGTSGPDPLVVLDHNRGMQLRAGQRLVVGVRDVTWTQNFDSAVRLTVNALVSTYRDQ